MSRSHSSVRSSIGRWPVAISASCAPGMVSASWRCRAVEVSPVVSGRNDQGGHLDAGEVVPYVDLADEVGLLGAAVGRGGGDVAEGLPQLLGRHRLQRLGAEGHHELELGEQLAVAGCGDLAPDRGGESEAVVAVWEGGGQDERGDALRVAGGGSDGDRAAEGEAGHGEAVEALRRRRR